MESMMSLTEEERSVILDMRRTQGGAKKVGRGRPRREYPFTLRNEGGVEVVKPDSGNHSGYRLYVDGELLCVCVYRKGAYCAMDYILRLKAGKE